MKDPSKVKPKICDCGRGIPRPFNSTISAKKCPSCTRISTNIALLEKSSIKTSKTAKKGLKSKKTPRQKAMDRADKYFSIYVRIVKSEKIIGGEVLCKDIITGRIYGAKNIDNGHFFSRGCKLTRYELDNCWPQNKSSNQYSGEADKNVFEKNIIENIGQERFDRINQLRWEEGEDTFEFYDNQAKKYLKLINDLANELQIIKWW